MRVIVINLFPDKGEIPATMLEVWDRMIELQFANKTKKDVQLARSINALLAVIEQLQSLKPGDPNPALADAKLEELAKYKVFENIISIIELQRRGRIELVRLLAGQHPAPHGHRLCGCEGQAERGAE